MCGDLGITPPNDQNYQCFDILQSFVSFKKSVDFLNYTIENGLKLSRNPYEINSLLKVEVQSPNFF